MQIFCYSKDISLLDSSKKHLYISCIYKYYVITLPFLVSLNTGDASHELKK